MYITSINYWNPSLQMYVGLMQNQFTSEEYSTLISLQQGVSIFDYGNQIGRESLKIKLYEELIQLRSVGKDVLSLAYTFDEILDIYPVLKLDYYYGIKTALYEQIIGVSQLSSTSPFLQKVFDISINVAIAGIVDLLVGKIYQYAIGNKYRPIFSIITTRWLITKFPPLVVTVRLLTDALIVLITEGLFALIAHLFITLIPKILALLIVLIMDTLLFFLYSLPFGIGAAIRRFRDNLYNWAAGSTFTTYSYKIETYQYVSLLIATIMAEMMDGKPLDTEKQRKFLLALVLTVLGFTDAIVTYKGV